MKPYAIDEQCRPKITETLSKTYLEATLKSFHHIKGKKSNLPFQRCLDINLAVASILSEILTFQQIMPLHTLYID